jgi:hypothetical protein
MEPATILRISPRSPHAAASVQFAPDDARRSNRSADKISKARPQQSQTASGDATSGDASGADGGGANGRKASRTAASKIAANGVDGGRNPARRSETGQNIARDSICGGGDVKRARVSLLRRARPLACRSKVSRVERQTAQKVACLSLQPALKVPRPRQVILQSSRKLQSSKYSVSSVNSPNNGPVKTTVMDRDGPAIEKSLPLIIARICKLAFFSKSVDSLAAVNLSPSRLSRK